MDDRHTRPPADTEPPYPETPAAAEPDLPVTSEAPPPVAVYDRPENTGKTNTILIGVIAVIVLVVLAILLMMFIF